MRNIVFGGILVAFLTACGGGGGGGAPAPQPIANRAPVANNLTAATDPGQDLNGTLTATDADGDALTYAVASMPSSGTVVLSGAGNADFTYTPNGGFSGADSFTFTAADAAATSAAATVTINVNTKPAVVGDSFETSEIVAISGVVTATDVEGDTLTFAVATGPTKGTVTNFDSATGAFTYTPDPAQDGADSFTVTADDGFQTSDAATVSIDIFQWSGTLQFGTSGLDSATTSGLYQAADGGFVLGGSTEGQIGSTPSNGAIDAYIRKLDRRGNVVWTTQFGTAGDDNSRVLLPDPDGSGTFVIAPGRDTSVTPSVDAGGILYKFDNDGLEQLRAPIDFQGLLDPTSATGYQGGVDANGDVYVLSWITGGSSLLTKVDGSNGTTVWQIPFEGLFDNAVTPYNADWDDIRLRSIQPNAAGNLIVSGFYWPAAGAARPCNPCAFIVEYSPAGAVVNTAELNDFANACGLPQQGLVYRVSVAPDQSLWAVGFGGPLSDDSFMQVTKYSSDGSTSDWTHCDPSGVPDSYAFTYPTFAANGDGLIYNYVANLDPMTNDPDSGFVVLTRLESDGTEVFRREIATTRADSSDANMFSGSVIEDAQGLLYITGVTDGEFSPGANLGNDDAFILRLAADGTVQ
ncbi:MAG: Ig-like domain-containing protein [Woeseiaceae bacterium]|nr:Ig-like domain-containing protein [Woeseiaceae bacterium]